MPSNRKLQLPAGSGQPGGLGCSSPGLLFRADDVSSGGEGDHKESKEEEEAK